MAGGLSTGALIGGTVYFIVFPPSAPAIAGAYGLCAGTQLSAGAAPDRVAYLKHSDQKAMQEVPVSSAAQLLALQQSFVVSTDFHHQTATRGIWWNQHRLHQIPPDSGIW